MDYDQFLEELSKLPSKGWIPTIEKQVDDGSISTKEGSIYLRKPHYRANQGHGPLATLATELSGRTHSSW